MPTFDSSMRRVDAEVERAQVEYLNPTAAQSWEWAARDLCVWCGSTWEPSGCFCRQCDSCARYWKDSTRKDFADGRLRMQVCAECLREGY